MPRMDQQLKNVIVIENAQGFSEPQEKTEGQIWYSSYKAKDLYNITIYCYIILKSQLTRPAYNPDERDRETKGGLVLVYHHDYWRKIRKVEIRCYYLKAAFAATHYAARSSVLYGFIQKLVDKKRCVRRGDKGSVAPKTKWMEVGTTGHSK